MSLASTTEQYASTLQEKNGSVHVATKALSSPWRPLSLIYSMWLFTESDFFTLVIPMSLFGISAALSGTLLSPGSDNTATDVLSRVPYVVLSSWMHLLVFDLANQRTVEAAVEDGLNKPWRPVPAGRMTPTQARRLLLAALPCVVIGNHLLGTGVEALVLVSLTYMYNDLRGGEDHFVIRNALISVAFGVYHLGAMRIATGNIDLPIMLTEDATAWLCLISAVILTTMHVQDMKDVAGDRMRGRHSAPIILGDSVTRWSIAVPVAIWSFVCPAYWSVSVPYYSLSVGLGAVVCTRLLLIRNTEGDKATWQIWSAWTAGLYLLPVFKDHSLLL
ncbi:UbiA prenyltransferase family [Geosmithia morbida]|uniref:UbiA prenyltransferase family n=1 Tax=Geosmithia morbida TaxID=1094350 RepID=A0A9P4YXH1_9HYPO|nr:UbiA prenyltransferase family [Geosmithia morbida]KAF4123594.1 UbiA prenyltransferase family [Geosmithia morbida]